MIRKGYGALGIQRVANLNCLRKDWGDREERRSVVVDT